MPDYRSIWERRSRLCFSAAAIALLLTPMACAPDQEAAPPVPADTLESDATASDSDVYAARTRLERPLPEFSRATLTGEVLESGSLIGKVSIVNFWATWCGPCIVEIPEFVVLYDEWKDRNFEIVGVSSDREGFEIVGPFAEELQMNYPVVLDADGTLGEAFGGVYVLPTTFLLNTDGTLVARYLGLAPIDELRADAERLFAEADRP